MIRLCLKSDLRASLQLGIAILNRFGKKDFLSGSHIGKENDKGLSGLCRNKANRIAVC
jgi:hypothetical protein